MGLNCGTVASLFVVSCGLRYATGTVLPARHTNACTNRYVFAHAIEGRGAHQRYLWMIWAVMDSKRDGTLQKLMFLVKWIGAQRLSQLRIVPAWQMIG